MKIAAIGECMIELSARPSNSDGDGAAANNTANNTMALAYGGDTLNTAVYLARLSRDNAITNAITVDYLTALGDDPYSDEMIAFWRREGIGTGLVARLPGRLPGLYAIRTDSEGERSFHYWRGAAAARQMMQGTEGARLAEALCGYDLIYLSGITLSILPLEDRATLMAALDRAVTAGARIAFDCNFRPRGWPDLAAARLAMDQMYGRCHIALPGLADECALHGEMDAPRAAERIAALGAPEICLKDGGMGCLLRLGEKAQSLAAEAVPDAVDTTAAGDSFNAAYLYHRLTGASIEAAARAGHRLAARVIQYPGAVIPLDAMPGKQ